jgi:hypothetical protein
MKRLFIICSLSLASMYAFSQLKSEPVKTGTDTAQSLIYTLPKSTLVVNVQIRHTVETPGIYFQYAERYLGVDDICQTETSQYEITNIQLTTKSKPDLDQSYLISGGKSKVQPVIEITPEGYLKSINGSHSSNIKKSTVCKTASKPSPKSWETLPSSIYTKEMQLASSTAKMAELAANQIFTIRDTRFNLLTQDIDKTPSDGHSYEIVLSELNRMETYYMDLFIGKRTDTIQTYTFEIEPKKEVSDVVLFRLSQIQGVVDKSNLGGSPVFYSLKKIPTPSDAARADKTRDKTGIALYYRQPGKALFTVSDGTTNLFSEEVTVPQFGQVMTLPPTQVKSVELCPETGTLLRWGNK